MQRKNLILIIGSVIFFALTLTAVLISLRTFNREGERRHQALISNTSLDFSETEEITVKTIIQNLIKNNEASKAILLFQLNTVDLNNLLIIFSINVIPFGDYKSKSLDNAPKMNITLSIGETTFKLKANENAPQIETSFRMDGDINAYPFDKYSKFLVPSLYNTDNKDEIIPVGIIFTGGIQGLRLNITQMIVEDDSIIMKLEIERSRLTLAFSLFIITAMWIISIMVLSLSIVIWFKNEDICASLLAVPVGCLFALPTVRNSQPNVPPVGTLGDVIGFFWNMIFLIVSVIILFTIFTNRAYKKYQNGLSM